MGSHITNEGEREDINLCGIYSSRQIRALTTAKIVGSRFSTPVKVISGLEEINFGLFEGHTWDEIGVLYPDELIKLKRKEYHMHQEGKTYRC